MIFISYNIIKVLRKAILKADKYFLKKTLFLYLSYKNAKSIIQRIRIKDKKQTIKDYKSMSKDKLLRMLNTPKPRIKKQTKTNQKRKL